MTTPRKKLDAGADRLIRQTQLGDTADVALRRVSQAANHGKLWFAAAGGVALTGPRGRDAAIGGLVSLGAASAMANLILKPLVGGKRPDPQTLSSARRLKGQPLSGAFPSGHAASAAAFATGASLSWPVLTPVLAPLAGLVGYSRIHTGAHWLSDVLAGLALGTGIGIVTNVALNHRDMEAQTEGIAPRADVPRLPRGAGLIVVANPHSGPDGSEDPATVIRRLLPEATLLVPGRDGANEDLDVLLEQAVNMP